MIINIKRFLVSLSKALDYAESELVGTAPYHASRVALITYRLMEASGHSKEMCDAAAAAALLHDCALREYIEDENHLFESPDKEIFEENMQRHCIAGEKIGKRLPFYSKVAGAILYHHERADGKGAFGKTAEEIPDFCQYIHIADMADVHSGLFYAYTEEKGNELRKYLSDMKGTAFCNQCVNLFEKVINDRFLTAIEGDHSPLVLFNTLSFEMMDISIESLRELSMIFADITDYKSHFTWRHSTGIAEKAYRMGKYYNEKEEDCFKLYIAGLLHDIGKLSIPNGILEKPGKLDKEEYRIIQNHAMGTWNLLKDISGMEDIASWAALHHEKLDGSGYPFGYRAEKLSENDRLMACLDIYQALTETRPYKEGMSHGASMNILYKMGREGQLDMRILEDIDRCFGAGEISAETVPQENVIDIKGPAYRCPVCGYVLNGTLPEDFICPRCEQPASVFEKIGQ